MDRANSHRALSHRDGIFARVASEVRSRGTLSTAGKEPGTRSAPGTTYGAGAGTWPVAGEAFSAKTLPLGGEQPVTIEPAQD